MYSQQYSGEEPMLYQGRAPNKSSTSQFNISATNGMQVMNDGIMDDEILNERGEEITPLISNFSCITLRAGTLLQSASLLVLIVLYNVFGNKGLFTFDLYGNGGTLSEDLSYYAGVVSVLCVYFVGVLFLAGFQEFIADNSKAPLGFRAGSRLLNTANIIQIVVIALRVTQFSFTYSYFNQKWYGKFSQTKGDWCLYNFGLVCEAVSLIMYGISFFYVESYADVGVGEQYAYWMLTLFTLAGLSELLMLFTGFGSFFILFFAAALVTTCIWAFQFEPLLESNSPLLFSRDINADVLPKETPLDDISIEKNQTVNNFQPNFTYQLYAGASGISNISSSYGVEMQQ
ncbi:membrane-associated protein [Cryptosporidium canis]|uniref:Membrane-associated protein n=1 Tax=Cryptosporidium canis TaxID=195482 RepID=A0ABQ8PAH4_9CRYT|nr:membrane-associated protein [Cryptosporidium canis]KAJ1613570.1 membrane-associated protein [Cryptosporidium canis]